MLDSSPHSVQVVLNSFKTFSVTSFSGLEDRHFWIGRIYTVAC